VGKEGENTGDSRQKTVEELNYKAITKTRKDESTKRMSLTRPAEGGTRVTEDAKKKQTGFTCLWQVNRIYRKHVLSFRTKGRTVLLR
jgi:hypothetical protein